MMGGSPNGGALSDGDQSVTTRVADVPAPLAESETNDLSAGFAAVLNQLADLRAVFDSKLRYDATKDHQIEQLHSELETHKRGERDSMQRAILMDVIRLYDDLEDVIAHSGVPEDAPIRRSLVAFQRSLIETLSRHGVDTYRTDGVAYNPVQQRPLQAAPTQDPALDMTVARRIRLGFRSADRILRQEIVDVYRYTPPSE